MNIDCSEKMVGPDDKMECDREDGEIIEENEPISEVDRDPKEETKPKSTLRKTDMSKESAMKTLKDDLRNKMVRFKRDEVKETKYYDRDSRPLREKNDRAISQRPLIIYDNICYVEIDNCEPNELLDTDKDTCAAEKNETLDDICIEMNTENSGTDKRIVRMEHNNSKRNDDQNKLKAESSSSLTKSKNDTRGRTKSVNKQTEEGETRKGKRSYSPRTRNEDIKSNKYRKDEQRAKHSHDRTSSSKRDYQRSSSSHRRNREKQPPFKKRPKREENDSLECPTESPRRSPLSYDQKKEFTKNSSPVLYENGKRVDSQGRERLRSCSPVSDRSLSPCAALDEQETQYIITKSTSAEQQREIAIATYRMLVIHLSTSRHFVTLNVLRDILRGKGIYLKQNEPTYLVKFDPEVLLEEFVSRHEDLFVVNNNDSSARIWPKTDVEICSRYTNKPDDSHHCDDLHVCKYYTLATCNRKDCRFNHNLTKNTHNKEVLKKFFLDNFDESQIQRLMQTKESRNVSTLPLICKFYNNQGRCDRPNCMHLHLCKYFITELCTYGPDCMRWHTILQGQPVGILKQHYGLSFTSESEAKCLISKTLKDGKVKLKKDFIKDEPSASTLSDNIMQGEKMSTKALPTILRSQKMGKTSQQKNEAKSKTNFSLNSLPDFIPFEISRESDDSEADNGRITHEDNNVDSKEIGRMAVINSTSENIGESCGGIFSQETSSTKHDDNLGVTDVKTDTEVQYSNAEKSNNRRVSLMKDILVLDKAKCKPARGGSECEQHIDHEQDKNAVLKDSRDNLTVTNEEAVTMEHDVYSMVSTKPNITVVPRLPNNCSLPKWAPLMTSSSPDHVMNNAKECVKEEITYSSGDEDKNDVSEIAETCTELISMDKGCHIIQQTADEDIPLVPVNSHTSKQIEEDKGNGVPSTTIPISSTEEDQTGACCVNNGIQDSTHIEKDCKNECNTRIEDGTMVTGEDSTTTDEISIAYKRNNMTQRAQFRYNSGNWQLLTSSGIWVDVKLDDCVVLDEVALICEKYAHSTCNR